jgi:hypothetical protein
MKGLVGPNDEAASLPEDPGVGPRASASSFFHLGLTMDEHSKRKATREPQPDGLSDELPVFKAGSVHPPLV